MPHTAADCQRDSVNTPAFTYRMPDTAKTNAKTGSKNTSSTFARIAAAKSNCSSARHIRLTPHAGQYSPVTK